MRVLVLIISFLRLISNPENLAGQCPLASTVLNPPLGQTDSF
jgi:hypothetical protein